jgi:hypothetical protein
MPRPGTEILIVDGAPPGAAALDTGTAFMFGQSERGPVTKAAKVVSAADYKSLFGSRSGGSILYDSVSTYFAEGGGNLYVSRVIGTGALAAAAAFGGLNATASSPGTWGNSLTVEAVAPTALAEVLAVDPQLGRRPDRRRRQARRRRRRALPHPLDRASGRRLVGEKRLRPVRARDRDSPGVRRHGDAHRRGCRCRSGCGRFHGCARAV